MEIVITEKKRTKEILHDIFLDVSWAKIAKRYFGKSPSWIYHKIDGVDSNGGEGGFSDKEREAFKSALYDLSDRIRNCANGL